MYKAPPLLKSKGTVFSIYLKNKNTFSSESRLNWRSSYVQKKGCAGDDSHFFYILMSNLTYSIVYTLNCIKIMIALFTYRLQMQVHITYLVRK